jgi:hypothetical protein
MGQSFEWLRIVCIWFPNLFSSHKNNVNSPVFRTQTSSP